MQRTAEAFQLVCDRGLRSSYSSLPAGYGFEGVKLLNHFAAQSRAHQQRRDGEEDQRRDGRRQHAHAKAHQQAAGVGQRCRGHRHCGCRADRCRWCRCNGSDGSVGVMLAPPLRPQYCSRLYTPHRAAARSAGCDIPAWPAGCIGQECALLPPSDIKTTGHKNRRCQSQRTDAQCNHPRTWVLKLFAGQLHFCSAH